MIIVFDIGGGRPKSYFVPLDRRLLGVFYYEGKEFASADTIVIAAPFRELSFPATLKQYFEQINIPHVTFYHNEQGIPRGLCKTQVLWYVTTAGGLINEAYGFGYIRELMQTFHGIPDIKIVKAEGLDIIGTDGNQILRDVESRIVQCLHNQKKEHRLQRKARQEPELPCK